jgi:hypothetical protein
VEQFQSLLRDFHVLAEGNRRGPGTANEVHPTPGLTRGMEFLDDRLMVLEGCI